MKIIANILVITKKDLRLSDMLILDQLTNVPEKSISAILRPEGYEYHDELWRVERLLREKTEILRSHISVIGYEGNATFKNLMLEI